MGWAQPAVQDGGWPRQDREQFHLVQPSPRDGGIGHDCGSALEGGWQSSQVRLDRLQPHCRMMVRVAETDDLLIAHDTEEWRVGDHRPLEPVRDEFHDPMLRLRRVRASKAMVVPQASTHFVRVNNVEARAAARVVRAGSFTNLACSAFSARSRQR